MVRRLGRSWDHVNFQVAALYTTGDEGQAVYRQRRMLSFPLGPQIDAICFHLAVSTFWMRYIVLLTEGDTRRYDLSDWLTMGSHDFWLSRSPGGHQSAIKTLQGRQQIDNRPRNLQT